MAMIRVGLIGLDSYHAYVFTELFNIEGAPSERRVYGARMVAAWDYDRGRVERFSKTFGDVDIVEGFRDMLSMVDAVMIVFRDGPTHLGYAKPFLEAGIPTFIDKPIALSLKDASEIVRLAEAKGTPFMSSSALRYSLEIGELRKRISGFGPLRAGLGAGPGELIFYGVHVSEMIHTVFGPGIEAVYGFIHPSKDMALVRYEDGKMVALEVLRDSIPLFHIVVYCEKGWDQAIVRDPAYYREMLKVFVDMVETWRPPIPYEWTLEVLKTLLAIQESSKTQSWVYLRDLKA